MRNRYLISASVAGLFLVNMAIGQCTLSIGSTASTVCAGNTVTLTGNAVGPANALTTTMGAGNNHRGNMFDITATNAVTITSFDASPMGNTTIAIYYKTGTWSGFANTPGAWTLIGSAAVVAQPLPTPTPVPVPVNITIPAGQTYAFYVTSTNTTISLNYTDGTTVGNVYSSDANISFREGAGMEYPFTAGTGSTFTPRVWNGVIHYVIVGASTTYLWNTTDVTQSISPVVSASTQYSLQATITGCPTLNATYDVAVSVPPVSAGADQEVCIGSPVTLSGSGAVSYTWDHSVTDNSPFTPASTLSYIVTGTDTIGCTGYDTVMVTVNNLPTVSAGSDFGVCDGSQATLSGSGAVSYLWDHSVTDGVPFTPASTLQYIVSGTDANGCVNWDTVNVTLNNLPSVSAGADQVACFGSQVTLSGSGASSYSWDNSVMDNVPFTATSTLQYIVTGTDANGCMNMDTAIVTVNSLPAISAGADQDVCLNGSVTLSGSGGVSYSWDNSVTDGVPFSPAFTLSYIVTGTDANGCMNTDTATVNVLHLPAVDAGPDQSVCAGSPVTLSGSGADTYVWDNGVTDGVMFVPTSTLTYNVTGTDVNGCTNTDAVTVTYNTVNTATTFLNETITATASGATYQWLNCTGLTPIAGQTGQSFTATANGAYAVVVTMNGCSDTSACQTISSVGINETSLGTYSVYPNPTNGKLTLVTGDNIADEVSILDVLGQTVATMKPAGKTVELSLEGYPNGVYFVRVNISGNAEMIRVIKQ